MKFEIDLNNIKVTNAIAGLINSAFETGLNPAWYQVESLNKDGFHDAAFAESNLKTPSGKPPRTNWSVKVRLYDEDADEPYENLDYTVVTPQLAVERWIHFANAVHPSHLVKKAGAFLYYLELLSRNADKKYLDYALLNQYEPDGVTDDAMVQYILASEVIFG